MSAILVTSPPTSIAFCDWCLENIPRWAGYVNEAFPDETFDHSTYDREYLEAHWEQSPPVLPTFWSKLNRLEKSRFLLEGSFFRYGRQDLDYFFYQYRSEAVQTFVKASHEAVIAFRPGIKTSAAVFKNPIHSGRFIGQDWRQFTPYVDTMIPMDYRVHYPGNFDHYLGLLAETFSRQQQWAGGSERYLTGFALWPLIRGDEREENRAAHMTETINLIANSNLAGCCIFCAGDLERWQLWDVVIKAW